MPELIHVAQAAQSDDMTDRAPTDALLQIPNQILRVVLISAQREEVAYSVAKKVWQILFAEVEKPLEVQIFVQLLKQLCDLSPITAREMTMRLSYLEEDQARNVPVMVALLQVNLVDLQRVDMTISRMMMQRKVAAVELLSSLMDAILFADHPIALRADFANSLEVMGQWLAQEPDLTVATQLLQKLRDAGVPETIDAIPDERSRFHRDRLEYAFHEWVRLCGRSSTTEKTYAAFISQLFQKQLMTNQEDTCLFFRLCIDASVEAFEQAEAGGAMMDEPYLYIDALAKLVILLVKYQGESEGPVKRSKPAYLNSILSLIVLVLNHHHVIRGERFNQKLFFRLFSTILCDYHMMHVRSSDAEQDQEMMLVFGNVFLTLQPVHFPGFVFGWLALISNRFFLPGMLMPGEQAGWPCYTQILEALLSYVGELNKPLIISDTSKEVYRGTLRILLVLHHDFPEFLAENHYRLCGAMPAHCTQLRNLILSAYPSSFPELPDPFTAGLKVDRIMEIRISPAIAGDYEAPIRRAQLKDVVDLALTGYKLDEQVAIITRAVHEPTTKETGIAFAPVKVDQALLTSLVLYIGASAVSVVGNKGGPTFVQDAPHADLLRALIHELNPEGRYYLLGAVANQLRYPNSHTHYFSYALLYLFGVDQNDQMESDVRQQITRVLLERLIVHRPHPWGLIITLLELLKNPAYMFWDLPFIKAAPEVGRHFLPFIMERAVYEPLILSFLSGRADDESTLTYDRRAQIERLFGALFQHMNQSPR